MSFRKKIGIIFLEEKIGFKMNYLKRQGQGSGATGWHNGKMGHDAGPVQEGEMRWGKKSRMTARNWAQWVKRI
jgi:hypothetical protein